MIISWHRPLPDNTQHSQQTNIHAAGGIPTHNPSRRAATDPRLRPRCHWDRCLCLLQLRNHRISKKCVFVHILKRTCFLRMLLWTIHHLLGLQDEGFLVPHPIYKLEYRPLSTVSHRLCNIQSQLRYISGEHLLHHLQPEDFPYHGERENFLIKNIHLHQVGVVAKKVGCICVLSCIRKRAG